MHSPTFPYHRAHPHLLPDSYVHNIYRAEMGPRKGFKVTDAERKVRVGIAVETLGDLRRKTVEKFKLEIPETDVVFQTRDGQFVDADIDFDKIKPQTLLIWVKRGDRAETDAEILYRTIREVNLDFLTTGEKVQEFFTEQMKTKVYKLAEVLKELENSRTKLNMKEEDAEWFKGLDSRSKTKEEYMFRRSQDRIRTYYYKTKDELLKKRNLPHDKVNSLLQELHKHLKSVEFFGCYFDRRQAIASDVKSRLCDDDGLFTCQGRWDKENCLYTTQHSINPYRSREDRIVFQTWNLDHRIERSRMIIPALCRAIESAASKNGKREFVVDVEQVFKDLFTVHNLKLVHIVCHDKGAHKEVNVDRYIKYV